MCSSILEGDQMTLPRVYALSPNTKSTALFQRSLARCKVKPFGFGTQVCPSQAKGKWAHSLTLNVPFVFLMLPLLMLPWLPEACYVVQIHSPIQKIGRQLCSSNCWPATLTNCLKHCWLLGCKRYDNTIIILQNI